jgi:hypothetical protein
LPMKLSQIFPLLTYKFKSEHDLLLAIEELSRNFTTQRDSLEDYLKDERLTSAYTAFYLSTNLAKFQAALSWLPLEFINLLKSASVIDVGAGPGTFSLAFRQWLKGPIKRVIQLETSRTMAREAQGLWEGMYPGEEISFWDRAREVVTGPVVMIFGHSANEMGPEKVMNYINFFRPDHVLFFEPGTKDFFPQMLKIREQLLVQEFSIIYPCPEASSCPLSGSHKDWCHQFLQVRHDPEVERLTQLAHKDRRLLPIIFHAYSTTFRTATAEQRLLRVFPETKFSWEWEICDKNQVKKVQLLKRGISRTQQKTISSLLAGAPLRVQVERDLGPSLRVKILD